MSHDVPTALERLQRIATGFQPAKVLFAAAELGLFEPILAAWRPAPEVAAEVGGDPRGVEILLDALVALGLVEKQGDRYRVPADVAEVVAEDSPGHFVAMLRHRNHTFRRWAFVEEHVRPQPAPTPSERRAVVADRVMNRNFIRAMYASGHQAAPGLVDAIGLEDARVVADLGGGPGHYLAEMARRDAALEPWLIDLPLTLEVARDLLADSGVAARVRFVAWDFYEEPAPPGLPRFDLVLVSQVLHSECPEANARLLAALFPLVAPGGRVVLHENVVEPDRTGPLDAALFAVNMLAMTTGGRTYTEAELAAWGTAAGFVAEPGRRLGPRSFLLTLRRPR